MNDQLITDRQFGECRLADHLAKGILLKLEQLNDKTGKTLVGWWFRLNILHRSNTNPVTKLVRRVAYVQHCKNFAQYVGPQNWYVVP